MFPYKDLSDYRHETMHTSRISISGMENRKIKGTRRVTPLQRNIADSIWYWMQKQSPKVTTVRQLSALTGRDKTVDGYVAASAIQNYLYPEVNQPTERFARAGDDGEPTGKKGRYPTVDKLANLARALGCEPWQLLHPNAQLADALGRDFAVPRQAEDIRVAQPVTHAKHGPVKARKLSRASH